MAFRRFVGIAPADVDAVRWHGEGDPDGATIAELAQEFLALYRLDEAVT